jgi:uncharacterized protein YuzE
VSSIVRIKECNLLSEQSPAVSRVDRLVHHPEMAENSENTDRFAYYDRDVDIVWLPVGPPGDLFGDEQPWGLVVRDRNTGSVAAIEIWSASQVLPEWLLKALPAPGKARSA